MSPPEESAFGLILFPISGDLRTNLVRGGNVLAAEPLLHDPQAQRVNGVFPLVEMIIFGC
jgi:hypothetical protein